MEEADFDFGLGGEWSSRTHDGYDGLGVIVVIFGWEWQSRFGHKIELGRTVYLKY